MSNVQQLEVSEDEIDVRLDRWFKRRFPALNHGRLEKLLRTGQVRVDGGRAKANQRLQPGQVVRVPPLGEKGDQPDSQGQTVAKPKDGITPQDIAYVKAMVLHKDKELIALNKPAGLAVQGGTGTTRHLDGLLDGLKFDLPQRPRLVHRLDRDTSGVMIVARTAVAAAALSKSFQSREMAKIYWALVIGYPEHEGGTISAKLAKSGAPGRERMEWDDEEGKKAITDYRVVATAGRKITWLELMPHTGRTHQLRAHCKLIGTPIIGDHKYTDPSPHADQRVDLNEGALAGIADRLCLHARSLTIPRGKQEITIEAPLPKHMLEAFKTLGFSESDA